LTGTMPPESQAFGAASAESALNLAHPVIRRRHASAELI
jgi:hypothetical protein